MKCDNCRYTKMCVRRFHTMGDTVNCGHYEEYEQRPHGEWIHHKEWEFDGECAFECSNCGMGTDVDYNFCPDCGADMRVKTDFN